MSEELRECPFCGSSDVTLWPMVAPMSGHKWFSPLCEDCGATIEENVTGPDTEAQVSVWNRRTADARVERMEKVVEAAKQIRDSRKCSMIPRHRRELVSSLASLTPEKAKSEG